MSNWPLTIARAWPNSGCRALFRERVEDFFVDEILGFEPAGTGEHVYLRVEKTDLNTDDVAHRIARLAGVRHMDVGYSGMKDRRAIARQWFSVYLSNQAEPEWAELEGAGLRLLQVTRHQQKLRRGQHVGNSFEIVLRELEGDTVALEQLLRRVRDTGFPNYFGEQRFGIRGANLDRAENLFRNELRQRDRQKRSIYLSAARSWLFNQVLSRRVESGSWHQTIDGDVVMAVPQASFSDLTEVPSGALYGDGPLVTQGAAHDIEQAVAEQYPLFINGLKSQRIRPERRSLIAYAIGLNWTLQEQVLTLRFALTSGSFATALLNECVELTARWFQTGDATVNSPVSGKCAGERAGTISNAGSDDSTAEVDL